VQGRNYTVKRVRPVHPNFGGGIELEFIEIVPRLSIEEDGSGGLVRRLFASKFFTAALDVFSNVDNLVRVGPLDIVMRQLPKLSPDDWKVIDEWRRKS
jgi:hypothetical protein